MSASGQRLPNRAFRVMSGLPPAATGYLLVKVRDIESSKVVLRGAVIRTSDTTPTTQCAVPLEYELINLRKARFPGLFLWLSGPRSEAPNYRDEFATRLVGWRRHPGRDGAVRDGLGVPSL